MHSWFFSVIYALLIIGLSGSVELAVALVKCADKVTSTSDVTYNQALMRFSYHNGKTYAIALSAVTGSTALPDSYFDFDADISREYLYGGTDIYSLKKKLSLGKYGAARPVSVPDAATQAWLVEEFGSSIPGGTYIDAWKEYGIGQPFTTMSGSDLPFSDWITPPELPANPSGVSMQSDGKFVPTAAGAKRQQIVEFDGKLDCAVDMDVVAPPLPPAPPAPEGQGTVAGTTANEDDPFAIPNVICGQDLNMNDFVGDAGEMLNCLQSTQGQLCTVGALDCNTDFQPPVCPSGSILDPERDMCQKDPEVKCAAGYTWDKTIDKCVMYPPCIDGGTYNSITDRCEKLVQNDCPVNYIFDVALQLCQKAVVCPSGGSLNASRDRCETPVSWDCPVGYSYNYEVAKCEVTPYCPSGWSYSITNNRCQITPNNCPAGYSYNNALDKCVISATCASGGALNGTSDKCELTAAITCNSGWTYNSGNGKCEQLPTCAAPGTYNGTYNLCITGSTGMSCPSGYYYSAAQSTCVAAPICNGGNFVAAYDRCEAVPSYSCPDPSYSYVAGRGRCEKTPVCPSGMSYNGTYNVCTQAIVKSCAAGYTYNAGRNRCEFSPPTCPSGTGYNTSTNRCEALPACASGTYSAATNNCVSGGSYAATCPSGYSWNGSTCVSSYAGTLVGAVAFDVPVYYNPSGEYCSNCYVYSSSGAVVADGTQLSSLQTGITASWYVSNLFYMCTMSGEGGCWNFLQITYYPMTIGGSYLCPSGGFLSGTTCTSSTSLTCPSGGTLSGTTCNSTTYTTATCQSGTSLDGAADRCVANPTCAGGSFDGTNDVCYVAYTNSCNQGTYDGASGLCVVAPTCSNGVLDGGIDVCYQAKATGCPGGYSLSGSVCIASPSCTAPGSFTGGTTDLCKTAATYLCPSGYSYSAGQCYQTANCNGGGLNTTSDKCEMAFIYTCPGTYAVTGSLCQAVPLCTTGGTYSTSLNLCDSSIGVCSAGALDTSLDVCYQAAGCANGVLNITRDKCEASGMLNCGGLSYDSTNFVCYSPPVCDLGAYQTPRDRCEATVTRNCGIYAWSAPDEKCIQPVTCPTDATFSLNFSIVFSGTLDICLSGTEHICSAGLTWNGLPVVKCEAIPVCTGAIYYDPTQNSCLISAGCPYGDQYTCMQNPHLLDVNSQGGWQCSANACVVSPEGGGASIDDIQDDSYLQDDGARDEDGKCLGQIYIMNGKRSRCRPAGYTVGYINDCCADGTPVGDDTGSSGAGSAAFKSMQAMYEGSKAAYQAYNGYQAGSALVGEMAANEIISTVTSEAIAAGASEAASVVAANAANVAVEGGTVAQGVASGMQSSTALSNATSAAGAAIAVYAVGIAVEKLGGDQDQVAAAQIAVTALLMSGPQMVIGIVVIVVMRFLYGSGCDINDLTTASFVESDRCHYINAFCEKKLPLVGCVQKAKGYCCFNSIMARIIHEQGRPQIGIEWGTASNPECRGFTPEEFQSLDFSRIDLTEYFEVMEKDIGERIGAAQVGIGDTLVERFRQSTEAATGVTP